MPRLKTEHIARLLNQPCETVRALVRTGAVSWGVYINPKSQRYGRGELKVDTLLKVFQFTGTKPETFFRQKFQDDRKNCSA